MKRDPLRLFLFRLAVATGSGWDIDKIERAMPLKMLYEWLAYAQHFDPLSFDPANANERIEQTIGLNTVSMVNMMGKAWFKNFKQRSLDEFAPEPIHKRQKDTSDPKTMYQALKSALIMGGHLNT